MATEVEVIKFEGDLSALRKDLKTAESSFSTLETKGKIAATNTQKSFNALGSSVKSVIGNLPFGHLVDDIEAAGEAAKNLGGAFGGISGQSDKAGGSIKALTSLIGVGLLGAITLVIAGFAAVVSFIKSTDEGATKLEATFNGVDAAVSVLSGRFAELGSSIVESTVESESFTAVLKTGLITALNAVVPGANLAADAIGNSGLAKEMGAAYDRAYDLAIELDAIQDAMRLLSVESKQTDLQIQSLLKQTKNRGIEITDRLSLVNEAQELENTNLSKNFELQKRYYENIAQSNLQKLTSINQGKQEQVQQVAALVNQIKSAKNADQLLQLYRDQVNAQEGLLSISDNLAQSQTDGLNSIIELSGKAEVSQEKFANIQSQLIEKDIADRTNGIKSIERTREAAAINTIKDADTLAKTTLNIQIDSLQKQRALLVSYGKDVSQIDLDIANLRKKYEDDVTKKKQEAQKQQLLDQKAAAAAAAKLEADNFNKSIEDIDINTKYKTLAINQNAKTEGQAQRELLQLQLGALQQKQIQTEAAGKDSIDLQLEIQAKQKAIYNLDEKAFKDAQDKKKKDAAESNQKIYNTVSTFAQQAESIYNGIAQNNAARTQNEITASQQATTAKTNDLAKQLDAGVITQEKYNASVAQLQAQQAKKENDLKAKQAKADKQTAEFNILINTAAAVIKTFATLGYPLGIPAALLAAAEGAAQYAIVASRPLPKYKDGVIDINGPGTGTSDSIPAMISKGETIMTADETSEHKDLFWAIRKNKLDDHVNRAWVLPAIERIEKTKQEKDHRYNKMMRKAFRKSDFDTSNLEREIRKNGKVKISNWHEMPQPKKGRNIV